LADARTLAALRARIRRLEGAGAGFAGPVARLGHPPIDGQLPWGGLPLAALHELRGSLASGLAAAMAGRLLAAGKGAIVWCADAALGRRCGRLYGPGLARFGIRPERLLVVHCGNAREVLWAAHEALASSAVAGVVLEVERLDLLAGRRLQLAAEAGGAAGLVLRFGRPDEAPSAAVSRWRAEPFFPKDANAARCWSLDLWRVKGGVPGHWLVRWDDRTLSFAAAHEPADRPAAPAGAAAAGGRVGHRAA
jgi:protein ImuA